MVKKYIGRHIQNPLLLSDFNETWICSTDFRKALRYQILWNFVQWEPSCCRRKIWQTDRHTWRSFSQVYERAYKSNEHVVYWPME
jgi:hypothetical protein